MMPPTRLGSIMSTLTISIENTVTQRADLACKSRWLRMYSSQIVGIGFDG